VYIEKYDSSKANADGIIMMGGRSIGYIHRLIIARFKL